MSILASADTTAKAVFHGKSSQERLHKAASMPIKAFPLAPFLYPHHTQRPGRRTVYE